MIAKRVAGPTTSDGKLPAHSARNASSSIHAGLWHANRKARLSLQSIRIRGRKTQPIRSRAPVRHSFASSGIALLLQFIFGAPARGENHADTRFEFYSEDGGRIQVETEGILFEQAIAPWATLRGKAVYDSISGATPTGAPAPGGSGGGGGGGDGGGDAGVRGVRPRRTNASIQAVAGATPANGGGGSSQVPLVQMVDRRYAGDLAADLRLANQTVTPELAYSSEKDYTSIGLALTDAIDFNQKNTTLVLGVSHDFDTVHPILWPNSKSKNSTEILIGVNQLLDPKTVLKLDFTYGFENGYLSDPYRGVVFVSSPTAGTLFPENRPSTRTEEIGFVSLTHFFDRLNGSAETSYRLYHDSYGIVSHTLGIQWYQKLGRYVIVSPLLRYTVQSAANFYGTTFPGDPTTPSTIPKFYSADYRLSSLSTYTYGLQITGIVSDRLRLDAGYERYVMQGNDGQTAASAYPTANIFTVGFRWLW